VDAGGGGRSDGRGVGLSDDHRVQRLVRPTARHPASTTARPAVGRHPDSDGGARANRAGPVLRGHRQHVRVLQVPAAPGRRRGAQPVAADVERVLAVLCDAAGRQSDQQTQRVILAARRQ